MLAVTAKSFRQTGVRNADRIAPANASNASATPNRRAGRRASAAPAARARPAEGRYSVRSASSTPVENRRLETGRNAIAIHTNPYASTFRCRRQAITNNQAHKRSEERRVGKEWRTTQEPKHIKKKTKRRKR